MFDSIFRFAVSYRTPGGRSEATFFKLCVFSIILFAFLSVGSPVRGQTGTPPVPADIYKSFVGTWIGTCCDFPGSKWGLSPVRLTITVDKDGKVMRWDYRYGTKGQKNFEEQSKFVALDPEKEKMTIKWHERDSYRTVGLGRVAQNGFGQFSANAFDGVSKTFFEGTYEIEPTKLSYQWGSTPDKKNYTMGGWFLLTREAVAGTNKN